MANYKGIKGFKVVSLASDPTFNSGQIWYNTTSYALKYDAEGAGAWSSGGTLNNARAQTTAAPNGTSTAGLLFGGAPGNVDYTESYNGTSWTEVNDLKLGRYEAGGGGTQAAALSFGGWGPGSAQDETEEWDGTSWTEVNDLNVGVRGFGSCGTQTAALAIGGGRTPSETTSDTVEKWDGTCWTEVNNLQTARKYLPGAGTVTAALAIGGFPLTGKTEEYDGTSWTEVNALTTARYNPIGFGIQTAALAAGGSAPAASALTEKYDGTSWTEVGDLASARTTSGGGGTTSNGLIAGGYLAPANLNISEEWADPVQAVKTVTVS